jgi:hypothetical protein
VTWAWCEDFDGQGVSAKAAFVPANSGIAYQAHSHVTLTGTTCDTSGNCAPYMQGGSLFLNAEDSGFGMNVLRVKQPFDFSGRTGHIHYRSNMKGHPRMHESVQIGPAVTNSMPDLRTIELAVNASPAISIDYVGDGGTPFLITTWKNGVYSRIVEVDGPLGIVPGNQYDIDIYISRTNVRLLLNGTQIANEPIPDIGFDVGYVYFAQLAYNPGKDGFLGESGNRFLWDNLAFDGQSLRANSLTPADKQDVLFRAFNKSSCKVRGLATDGPINANERWIYETWHARIGALDPPVTRSDITCTANTSDATPNGEADIGDIQAVKQ